MGVFLNGVLGESTGYEAIQVPEVEGYNGCHELAALQIQHETMANDLAIFKSALISDVRESQMILEGVSEEEVLTESFETAKGVLNKLKEMLLKLLAKIKAIVSAFIAKLSGLSSDYKALFDKYKKVIAGHSDWKKFKFKYQPLTGNSAKSLTLTFPIMANDGIIPEYYTSTTEIPDDDDVEEKVLKQILPTKLNDITSLKDLKKELHEYLFESEELIDGDSDNISGSDIIKICEDMPDMKKHIDNVKKLSTSLETNIKKRISELGKMQSKIIDVAVSKDSANKTTPVKISDTSKVNNKFKYKTQTLTDTEVYNKSEIEEGDFVRGLGISQKFINCEQRVVTEFNNCYLSDVRFYANQIKRIWTSAAAFASLRKENQELYSLMGEIALQENNDYFASEAV